MKLKINSNSNNSLRIKNRKNLFSNIFNSNKKYSKSRQDFLCENSTSMKNNNENMNTVNMNYCSTLEINYNNNFFNEKKKPKRVVHSPVLIKSRNIVNKKEKLPKIIYNIKHIHQFVSMIQKNYKVFQKIKKESNARYFLSSIPGQKNKNKPCQYKEKLKNEINEVKNKKNKLLVPYPFKRLQKRVRKFFSLSKIINNQNKTKVHKPSEGDIISNNVNISHNNQCLVKVLKLKNKKIFEDKKSEIIIYRYKMNLINNVNKGKILKKDKSVSTDNIFFGNNYYENKRKNSLFNNKLIASLAKSSINNISNYNNKYKRNESSRSIIVYHKNN